MFFGLILLIILFSIVFAFVWVWFFKNETLSAEQLNKKGMKAFKRKHYNEAKDFFLEVFALEPEFKNIDLNLAFSFFELGEDEIAKEYFTKILENTPENFDSLLCMAKLMHKEGNYEKAEEFYSKAIEVNPKSWECLFNLGILTYKKHEYNDAWTLFKNAGKLVPKNVQVLCYITMCEAELYDLSQKSKYKSIMYKYKKVIHKKGLPAELGISLAKVYAKTGQIDKALTACKKVLKSEAEDIEVYKILGLIQLIKHDFVGARNTLSTALHLQPKNKEIHEILSYLLCQQSNDCERENCRLKYYEMVQKFL